MILHIVILAGSALGLAILWPKPLFPRWAEFQQSRIAKVTCISLLVVAALGWFSSGDDASSTGELQARSLGGEPAYYVVSAEPVALAAAPEHTPEPRGAAWLENLSERITTSLLGNGISPGKRCHLSEAGATSGVCAGKTLYRCESDDGGGHIAKSFRKNYWVEVGTCDDDAPR